MKSGFLYHAKYSNYGAMELTLSDLQTIEGHKISERSISYHNEVIFGRKL
jgi:hypothetical protein